MYLILTGGGTAGHIMPNIALKQRLAELYPDLKFLYIGSKNGLENKLVPEAGIELITIQTGKLRRYFDLQNFLDILRVPVGIIQSIFILNKKKPALIFSKGGYVGLPVVIAGRLLGIPIIIHESDSMPGLTTKLCVPLATEIWASYKTIKTFFPNKKIKQVKLPVRRTIQNGDSEYYNFHDRDKPTLLVMGGSLGAGQLNDFIYSHLSEFLAEYNVLHICGRGKSQPDLEQRGSYYQFEYIDSDLRHAYAAADLIVSRAGASALDEMAALNKKVILVPLPTSKSRGEQIANANIFAKEHAGEIIFEQDLTFENFQIAVKNLEKKTTNESKESITNLAELFAPYLV